MNNRTLEEIEMHRQNGGAPAWTVIALVFWVLVIVACKIVAIYEVH